MKRIYSQNQKKMIYQINLNNDRNGKLKENESYIVYLYNDRNEEIIEKFFVACTKNDLSKIERLIKKYSDKKNCEKAQDKYNNTWYSGSFKLVVEMDGNFMSEHKAIIN